MLRSLAILRLTSLRIFLGFILLRCFWTSLSKCFTVRSRSEANTALSSLRGPPCKLSVTLQVSLVRFVTIELVIDWRVKTISWRIRSSIFASSGWKISFLAIRSKDSKSVKHRYWGIFFWFVVLKRLQKWRTWWSSIVQCSWVLVFVTHVSKTGHCTLKIIFAGSTHVKI